MKYLINATAALALAATSSLALESHELHNDGNWSTNLNIFDDGSMVCTASSSIKKPGNHHETFALHSHGSGVVLVLFNSALQYAEGSELGIGLQVDEGPVGEFAFVSVGGGALVSQLGTDAVGNLETFMAGDRLRTLNLHSGNAVSEYDLSGSHSNALELAKCVGKLPRTSSDYGPAKETSEDIWS